MSFDSSKLYLREKTGEKKQKRNNEESEGRQLNSLVKTVEISPSRKNNCCVRGKNKMSTSIEEGRMPYQFCDRLATEVLVLRVLQI